MNGHGDADANLESVGDRQTAEPPLFREERQYRGGHGERDGRVGRRPTPEDPASEETKSEIVANIGADNVRGKCPAGNRLICSSDQGTDEFRLADSPPDSRGRGTSGEAADRKQNDWEGNGKKSADNDGGKHA